MLGKGVTNATVTVVLSCFANVFMVPSYNCPCLFFLSRSAPAFPHHFFSVMLQYCLSYHSMCGLSCFGFY